MSDSYKNKINKFYENSAKFRKRNFDSAGHWASDFKIIM